MRRSVNLFLPFTLLFVNYLSSAIGQKVMDGHLPVVITDDTGTVHLVYGLDSTIYYTTITR